MSSVGCEDLVTLLNVIAREPDTPISREEEAVFIVVVRKALASLAARAMSHSN